MVVACASSQVSVHGSETLPWGVYRIRSPSGWDNDGDLVVDEDSNSGWPATVAVIDSGIDYEEVDGQKYYHEDLNANVVGGKGFFYNQALDMVVEVDDYKDDTGHGTHVAGTIAAVDNTIGVIGAAPKARILALKIFNYHPLEAAAAINWAIEPPPPFYKPHVISMSFAYPDSYTDLYAACQNAYANGILLIAAAGNENTNVSYPAAYDSVRAIGAVNESDNRWVDPPYGSNFGLELEFAAPGVNINSTDLNNTYTNKTGTSMATPHVAAVAALIWSSKIDPDYDFGDWPGIWENIEVREKLKHLCLDLGPPERDEEYGYGLINGWATNQRPLGDVNIDYKVDMKDVRKVSRYFGASWPPPNPPDYPANYDWAIADITIDNKVDMVDVRIPAVHFGEVDP